MVLHAICESESDDGYYDYDEPSAPASHVVLVLDTSKSMGTRDVDIGGKPGTRLSAVFSCCMDFIRNQLEAGCQLNSTFSIITFNDHATTPIELAPMSHGVLQQLSSVQRSVSPRFGTKVSPRGGLWLAAACAVCVLQPPSQHAPPVPAYMSKPSHAHALCTMQQSSHMLWCACMYARVCVCDVCCVLCVVCTVLTHQHVARKSCLKYLQGLGEAADVCRASRAPQQCVLFLSGGPPGGYHVHAC